MKKIALVSLSNAMGMQLYCSQLANTLAIDYDVSIIVTRYFDASQVNKNVKIYDFFTTKRPTIDMGLINVKSYINALKIIDKCDVIHFLNSHPANILLLNRTSCKNTVFTLHDPTPHSKDLLGKCRAIIDKIICKQSCKIIVHSKMHFENDLVKKHIEKVYLTSLASKSKSEQYYPIKNKNVFLFFGRIEDYKGLDLFIRAIELLSRKTNNFKAVIAGAGDFSKYESLIEHKENYIIKNYIIPENEVEELFINATFCIMPYKSASQSGVIPLSYYYSRPVIVSEIESLKENVQIDKTGFVVNPDYRELCKLLMNILDNRYNIADMSYDAYLYGNTYLSMEKMAVDFLKIYFGGL